WSAERRSGAFETARGARREASVAPGWPRTAAPRARKQAPN
ncbi:MAG: hypothetical protein AVDCRST_MAG13-773, partial [uncultured Solirubrobacteraceae bacterium]